MIKSVTAIVVAVACSILTVVAVSQDATYLAGVTAFAALAMPVIAFTSRGFLFTAFVVFAGIAPLSLCHGHPWIAGICAYVGLTMMFLAWNHAVHSLNRASDERQARWTPATEQR